MTMLLLALALIRANAADASPAWIRHTLTEKHGAQTLLLVVDVPNDSRLLPVTVLRKSMPTANLRHALDDLPPTPPTPTGPPAFVRTPNPLWPIDHNWTAQDESEYASWLQKTANPDYLVGSGLQVDCADYAVTLRWIYAHDHRLPAADQLGATGELVGSWESTAAWDALASDPDWHNDLRFKAALRYMLNGTYTHSVFTDMYPVQIDRTYVEPGTIYLTLTSDSGHTRTIYNIGTGAACADDNPCISIIWGNEPASEEGFLSDLVPYYLTSTQGGFMRFRWPEQGPTGWQLRAAADMPGYSTQQYDWTEVTYLPNVAAGLNLWNTPEERYSITGNSTATEIYQRVQITERGYFLCSVIPCAKSDPLYVEYSTPVRDQNLNKDILAFQTTAAQVDPNSTVIQRLEGTYVEALFPSAPNIFEILNGQYQQAYASDPTADFFARWGMQNVDDLTQMKVLTQVIADNWFWREDQVTRAQKLCLPNHASAPTCLATDPKVQALATDRLDQAFRQIQTTFLTMFNAADAAGQQEVRDMLNAYGNFYCAGYNVCTLTDYVLDHPTLWQTMTSSPLDSLSARSGH